MRRAALKKAPCQPAYIAWCFALRLAMYRPSAAMSWVAEANDSSVSSATPIANQPGS